VERKRLSVLGEVNKRFVVAPDVDALLVDMARADQQATTAAEQLGEGLIRMDED
jgi:DNA-directed RNA polymerase III subunit RPC4